MEYRMRNAHAASIHQTIEHTSKPRASYGVLGAISFTHLINDMMQSVLLALYPVLQGNFDLSFVQIGFITVAFQCSASLLQPLVGRYTDKKPMPYSLPIGMGFTLVGLLLLSQAWNYPMVLIAAILVGTGSSVFHPESSRVARMASAGRPRRAEFGLKVWGDLRDADGGPPAAAIFGPPCQPSVALVSFRSLGGFVILGRESLG